VAATDYFPALPRNHALATKVPDLDIPPHLLVKGPCPRIDRSLFVPGFPTFRHIKFTTKLECVGVKVFDTPAAKDRPTLVIRLEECSTKSVEDCSNLLGKSVWVRFPHLQEALVEGIMDKKTTLRLSRINGNQEVVSDETDDSVFLKEKKAVHER
jgi:5'-3' exoribonuclease 1